MKTETYTSPEGRKYVYTDAQENLIGAVCRKGKSDQWIMEADR